MARKIWTAEEKLSIVVAMLKGDIPVAEICQQYQVSPTQAYRWRDQFNFVFLFDFLSFR